MYPQRSANLKVLVLASGGDIGGAKTHIISAFGVLNRREPGSCLMVSFREGGFAQSARDSGIPTAVINSGNPLKDLRALKKLAADGGYDIIHSHGARANFMAMLLRRHVKAQTVTTVHSDYKLDYLGRPLANITYGLANRIALRRLDYLIGVTDATADMLTERGFAPDRIFTIHNGIEIPPDIPHRNSADANAPVTIGIAARLNPVKDISTLIRAFAKLSDLNVRLRIAGDGEEMDALTSLSSELGIADRVEFLGWVNDMDGFYSSIDINVLCSVSETFPYALLEGVKAGLATVSSKVGGVAQMIDDGCNGFLFNAGDIDTLADALRRYASDAELRSEHGSLLRAKVAEKFSLDAMVDTQTEIYRAILRKTQKRGKRYGIAVCGAYGMGNIGDESILSGILSSIREADADIPVYVLSRSPKQTQNSRRVRSLHTFSIFSFFRVAGKVKVYINGGGSLIQDQTSSRSLWFYLCTIMVAKLRGAKVFMYGCGIGPVSRKTNRRLAGRIINNYADVITLREDGSVTELAALGVTRPAIKLAADPVFGLDLPLAADRTSNDKIAVALRDWTGMDAKIPEFARALEYAYSAYGLSPLFVPIDQRDSAVAEAVAALLPSSVPCAFAEPLNTPEEAARVMSQAKIALSARLHGLIFAAAAALPLIGIVYDPKVKNFLDYIGQPNYIELGAVSFSSLKTAIDSAMKNLSAPNVARLHTLEQVNRDTLKALLSN
jgi:polysaccharide pyruvyl transferase CsaB